MGELLKANGVANVFHCRLMAKHCDTSAKQRSMMEEMAAAGVQPDVVTYTTLVNQLMIEGKYQEARAVVETEMPAAGVEPNDRTQSLLEKPEEDLSRMRTKHLQDLLKRNTPEARQRAQEFFEGLTVSRVADSFHCSVMLTHCDTSAEQRSVVKQMVVAGVQPDVVTYNTLAKQLMFEGNVEEARAVVEREMPAAGVEPNDRTQSVLEKPEELRSRMRTKHLQDLLKTNTPEAKQQAQVFFEGLTVNGLADVFQFSLRV